jgi:hypothetical protein
LTTSNKLGPHLCRLRSFMEQHMSTSNKAVTLESENLALKVRTAIPVRVLAPKQKSTFM